jgi:hypothetical protein
MLWPNACTKFSEHGIRIFYVQYAQSSLHAEYAGLKDRFINNQKQLENVEYFSYLDSQFRNDARFACEIKPRISITKASEEDSFRQQIRLKFNERNIEVLHLEHSFLRC